MISNGTKEEFIEFIAKLNRCHSSIRFQKTITRSKSTKETPEKGVKYAQS